MAAVSPDTTQKTIVFDGVAKMDLTAQPGTDACIKRITHKDGSFGGECIFVPAHTDPSKCDGMSSPEQILSHLGCRMVLPERPVYPQSKGVQGVVATTQAGP